MSTVLGRPLLLRAATVCCRCPAPASVNGQFVSLHSVPIPSVIGAADGRHYSSLTRSSPVIPPTRTPSLLSSVRSLCAASSDDFAEKVEAALRRTADQRKMKPGVLDDFIALVREAVSQGYSGNPDYNEDLQAKMDALGPMMLYVGGSFLVMLAKELDARCLVLAAPFFRSAGLSGHLGAKYSYGRLLLDGHGVAQNAADAAQIFQEVVAESTDKSEPYPQAVFTLATMYFHGNGMELDVDRALGLFEQSLDAGLTQAYHSLGMLYQRGSGVAVDMEKAVDYYRRGAEANNDRCVVELAMCHLKGIGGLEKNAEKGVEMFHTAAVGGNAHAMHSLGVCYLAGDGVAQDEEKAAYWWTQAADMSHPRACSNLAMFYLDGRGGVPKDVAMARHLLRVAVQQGLSGALQLLDEIDRLLKEDPSRADRADDDDNADKKSPS